MAETAVKKNPVAMDWLEKTGLSSQHPIRMVKMVVPLCKSCPKRPGWWDRCKHDPYHSMATIDDGGSGAFVQQADGTFLREEGATVKVIGYRRVPNVLQVPLLLRISSGLEVVRRIAMGAKFPHELTNEDGAPYQDMCEYQNCYAPDPKVTTSHSASLSQNNMIPAALHTGHYCSERHAKLAKRKESESMKEVYKDSKTAEQIASITL